MVLWKEEMHRAVLTYVRPAFRFMLEVAGGRLADITDAKSKMGFNSPITKKYYAALTRFSEEVTKSIEDWALVSKGKDIVTERATLKTPITDINKEILIFRDILCAMIDEELWFTPRWHNLLLKVAKEEGLLEPTPEPV